MYTHTHTTNTLVWWAPHTGREECAIPKCTKMLSQSQHLEQERITYIHTRQLHGWVPRSSTKGELLPQQTASSLTGSPEISEYFFDGSREGGASMLTSAQKVDEFTSLQRIALSYTHTHTHLTCRFIRLVVLWAYLSHNLLQVLPHPLLPQISPRWLQETKHRTTTCDLSALAQDTNLYTSNCCTAINESTPNESTGCYITTKEKLISDAHCPSI